MRLGFASVIALCASPLATAEWTVTDLLSVRSEVVETHASFIQDRHSLLLNEPLRSRGRLHYRAPGFLLQEIDAPFASRTVLDGDTLLMWRDGREVSMSLRRSGRVGLYARALRGVLSGRIGDIAGRFRIDLSGTEERWTLRLTLRDDLSSHDGRNGHVASAQPYVEVRGRREKLRRIEVRESPTERTVMEIHEAR